MNIVTLSCKRLKGDAVALFIHERPTAKRSGATIRTDMTVREARKLARDLFVALNKREAS